jgi:hypothetical protein
MNPNFRAGFFKAAEECKHHLPGGLAEGKPDSDFDPKEIEKGMKVESEHTTDKCVRKEISKDHLSEDPRYYTHLQKMERKYA